VTYRQGRRPLVMGVVNLTADSFSDGGWFLQLGDALKQARRLIAEGADILDLGAESTRPGAQPVSAQQELDRLLPLIEQIRASSTVPISVDTMKPQVARAAVLAGATMWNDVTALGYEANAQGVAASLGCEVVLMHMQGEPRTMQDAPAYGDVVAEVERYLLARAADAEAAGVARDKIWIDPGIGFGKTVEHNLALLNALPRLCARGYRVLLGASRKRFLKALSPSAGRPVGRIAGRGPGRRPRRSRRRARARRGRHGTGAGRRCGDPPIRAVMTVTTRAARPADAELIHSFVAELAEYEKLTHALVATPDDLASALFAPQPRVFCDIAVVDGEPVGFALWFYSFSTFLGRAGLYLEDLYVRPAARGQGAGKALLLHLAKRCATERLGRMDWAVLDWNTPSIGFYTRLGARLTDDWTGCRLEGEALQRLAAA
jgi:dihydropteroate synthase